MAYAPSNLTHFEQALHSGKLFFMTGFQTLNNGDTFFVKIVTPSAKDVHIYWDISSNTEMESYLYEDVTAGVSGGTSVTPLNANRISADASGVTVTAGVTVNSGTFAYDKIIDSDHEGSDSRQVKQGISSLGKGRILKRGKTYVREFKSNADDNVINFMAEWIEED